MGHRAYPLKQVNYSLKTATAIRKLTASEFTFIQRAKDTCRAFGAEVSPDTFVALLTAFG